jgi:hypothetical protein
MVPVPYIQEPQLSIVPRRPSKIVLYLVTKREKGEIRMIEEKERF